MRLTGLIVLAALALGCEPADAPSPTPPKPEVKRLGDIDRVTALYTQLAVSAAGPARETAARLLSQLKPDETEKTLQAHITALGHPDAAVRVIAAGVLMRAGASAREAAVFLEPHLADDDPHVRVTVARALLGLELQQDRAITALLGAVGALDSTRAKEMVAAIVNAEASDERLVLGLSHSDADARILCLSSLVKRGDSALRPCLAELERLRRDDDPRVSAIAQQALESLASQD